MAEAASSQSNTRKLDEILRRLDGSPTVDDWHTMATMLAQVKDKLDGIGTKVVKLDEVVNGNGKPGLKIDVSKLQDGMNAITRIMWIVVGAAVSGAIATFVYLSNIHPLP